MSQAKAVKAGSLVLFQVLGISHRSQDIKTKNKTDFKVVMLCSLNRDDCT